MGVLVFEGTNRAFTDRGLLGAGVPSYSRAVGYTPSEVPTAVGARMFFPEPEYDTNLDQPIPAAMGNKWDGGRPVYQQRVYNAAKKEGKEQGLNETQIDGLKPRQVA